MKIHKNIKSLRKDLVLIFILSFVIIIIIDFWLMNVPEIIPIGAELGNIIYRLSFAYITSFIFYFLVVHIKNEKDKENLKPFTKRNVQGIISIGKSINLNLTNKSDFLSLDELKEICSKTPPKISNLPYSVAGLPNISFDFHTWFQYIDYCRLNSWEWSNYLFQKSNVLDSELSAILLEIEGCGLFEISNKLKNSVSKEENIILLHNFFFHYFSSIIKLENYYNQKLIK